MGSLDLNVRPKDTAVYVDGGYVGIVGNYDGYPGYLWLDEGLHQVVLHKSGYQTLAQDYRIIAGNRIKVRHKMQKGVATAPQELFKPPPVLHQQEKEQPATQISGQEPWREKRPVEPTAERSAAVGTSLHLDVEPDQASIYLDGRFLGIGGEIVSLSIEPGSHRIEVIYPGQKPQTRDFEARAGESVEIQVELQAPEG
jgi:hypothetical protein